MPAKRRRLTAREKAYATAEPGDPFGAIHAVAERGLFTGNRGIIHDPATKTLLNKRWALPAWIICLCDYQGRKREPMGRNRPGGKPGWTELFFLDERVLLNLIDNALKFSGDGSAVTIRAQHNGGRMLQIDVIDQGPGVPDDYKTRLFDRFVQVKDQKGKRRGSGLGLTFCRLVIENHGGRIWVWDNPAGGSIFSFTLPTLKEKDKTKEVQKA